VVMKRWQAIILFLYFLLVGSVLLVAPWTKLWEVSVFAYLNGFAGGVYRSFIFRFVTASLGAATLIASDEVYKKFIGQKDFFGRRQ
jgi:hypothetical protein